MASDLIRRRVAAVIGGGAVLTMIGFAAGCSTDSESPQETPTTTTTTTTTTTPPLSPTEKAPSPGDGIFTPPVTADPPTLNPNRDRYGQ